MVKYPLRAGMPREEMRRRVKFKGASAHWTAFCAAASEENAWHLAGDRIAPNERGELPPVVAAAVETFENTLKKNGLAWPGEAVLAEMLPADIGQGYRVEELLRYLLDHDKAMQITPDYIVHPAAWNTLLDELRRFFADQDGLSFARFRELTGLSRKLGIPLLEHLDRIGLTRREGDLRVRGSRLE
jgi:selenocysteine-specific elongation factor